MHKPHCIRVVDPEGRRHCVQSESTGYAAVLVVNRPRTKRWRYPCGIVHHRLRRCDHPHLQVPHGRARPVTAPDQRRPQLQVDLAMHTAPVYVDQGRRAPGTGRPCSSATPHPFGNYPWQHPRRLGGPGTNRPPPASHNMRRQSDSHCQDRNHRSGHLFCRTPFVSHHLPLPDPEPGWIAVHPGSHPWQPGIVQPNIRLQAWAHCKAVPSGTLPNANISKQLPHNPAKAAQ